MAVGGAAVDLLHLPREKEDVQIVVRLPQSLRTSPEDLLALRVRGANPAGALVPLRAAQYPGRQIIYYYTDEPDQLFSRPR